LNRVRIISFIVGKGWKMRSKIEEAFGALNVTPKVAVCVDKDGATVYCKIVIDRLIYELEKALSSGKDLYEYLNNNPTIRDDMFNWFKSESLKGETDE